MRRKNILRGKAAAETGPHNDKTPAKNSRGDRAVTLVSLTGAVRLRAEGDVRPGPRS